jgi:hypothetical protein
VASEVDGGAQSPEVCKAKNQTLRLSGQMIDMVAPDQLPKLMPTPVTTDAKPVDVANQVATRNSLQLQSITALLGMPEDTWEKTDLSGNKDRQVGEGAKRRAKSTDLMPTPKALDGVKGNLKTTQERIDAGHFVDLTNVANDLATQTNWGKFEPAIRRWEQTLGRAAPSPTKPDGRDGAHRLSSKFTEWMMGLPTGWVTDAGLTRNDELKACGNGVVPQQAEMALRALLGSHTIAGNQTQVNLPTPTVSDTYTGNLKSTQQKEGSMHSVTLPQAVGMVTTA